MGYVLSVIHPPVAPAAFGKAVVSPGMPSHAFAVEYAVQPLMGAGLSYDEATRFAGEVWLGAETTGQVIRHEPTGIEFRIDPADQAPHPCPCGEDDDNPCRRLVLPTDHAYAHDEDAYCLGCYTWSRDVKQCLPVNTGHTEAP